MDQFNMLKRITVLIDAEGIIPPGGREGEVSLFFGNNLGWGGNSRINFFITD